MNGGFEWMRIGIAVGLMTVCFVLLPAYFLWKDKRDDERSAAAALEERDAEMS